MRYAKIWTRQLIGQMQNRKTMAGNLIC